MTRHAEHGNMIQGQNLCLISQNMTEMMGSTDSSNNLHSFSSVRVCWDYLLPYCTQFLTCIGNVTQWETLCTQSDRTIHWHMIIWATERMRGPREMQKWDAQYRLCEGGLGACPQKILGFYML